MAPGFLIQVLRESGGNGCKLASHQSLNEIHRNCEISKIEESAALDISQIPSKGYQVSA